MDLILRAQSAINKHRMIPAGSIVCAAVSGGPDSVAMLHALHRLSGPMNFTLRSCHYDHAFRKNSADDAQFTVKLAQDLGIEIRVERNPGGKPKSGAQAKGRELRYAFFKKLMADGFAGRVATGHTLDDSVETSIMWMLRGAGPSAFGGVPPVRDGFIRPLIEIGKKDILLWLDENHAEYVKDPSNDTDDYLRNRIRHHLIPAIESVAPGAAATIARTARLVAGQAKFVEELARETLEAMIAASADNSITVDPGKLAAQPEALKLAIIHKAALRSGADPAELGLVHLESILRMAGTDELGKQVDLPGGFAARLDHAGLSIFKKRPVVETAEIQFTCPLSVPFGGKILSVDKAAQGEEDKGTVDISKIPAGAVFRSRREGDYLHLSNMKGRKKLKEFFVDRKVPSGIRGLIPLLAAGSEVLWIPGLFTAAALAGKDGEKVAILWE
ncbi:MAG: tRNA lysidine(34) synthetase TilS [Nitrospinae bacterium]|nr:tRNA lysidine(34) synthetase TilS [Nitrospinota bacterium]